MSSLAFYLKNNKKQKENVKYAATKSLCDENGKPVEWTFRSITTRENDEIRDSCIIEVPVTGKPNQFRPKLNTSKYLAKLISKSVVEPNLYDKELQDSYGVMTPEELIKEMIDDPGEYSSLLEFVQRLNGFTDINRDIEEAKN